VEDQKALQTSAVVGKFADAVKDKIDDLLSNCVVTTGIVVGCVFLARDNLLRVVELAVSSSADLIADTGLKIDKDSTWNVLASTSLREEGVERIITATHSLVRGHLSIRLDSVLQTIQFPAGISGLNTSLAQVKRENFAHFKVENVKVV